MTFKKLFEEKRIPNIIGNRKTPLKQKIDNSKLYKGVKIEKIFDNRNGNIHKYQ